VSVLERRGRPDRQSRASTFHPATLDLLDELGVAAPLIERGRVVERLQWRTRIGTVLAEMDMALLTGLTRHPFRLHAEQSTLSGLLLAELADHPQAEICFGQEVSAVDDVGAVARVRAGGRWHQARYLIAADGAHSTIRVALGLAFASRTYPTQALRIMTDSPLHDWVPGLAPLTYVRDPLQSCSLLALPDHWRIVIRLPREHPAHGLQPRHVAAQAHRALPMRSRRVHILQADSYRLARASLTGYRRGRVLFAGDAAHLSSTAGGLNMNAGIHDAVELGRVLADVVRGSLSSPALEGWAHRRRGVFLRAVVPRSEARVDGVQVPDPAQLNAALDRVRAAAADVGQARIYLAQASMLDTVPEHVRHS
jgi:2-polyprenyl-6-methoxyphenol hydroxylase-like FAD-dependent oxidoreductase